MSDYTGPGIYFLESVATKTLVNLTESDSANGTKVIGYQRFNTSNELWQIADAGHDQYFLINAATGTYLTAPANKEDQVTTGNLIAPTSNLAKWNIVPAQTGKGGYAFHSVAYPGDVLDLRGSNAANNTDCIIYEDTPGNANQAWLIKLP